MPLQYVTSDSHQGSQFLDFLKMIVYNAFLRLVLPCHQCLWSEQWREECRSLQSFPQTYSDLSLQIFRRRTVLLLLELCEIGENDIMIS